MIGINSIKLEWFAPVNPRGIIKHYIVSYICKNLIQYVAMFSDH